MSYFPPGKSGGVSPRPEAQDTDKAAKEAMARKGDDAPKIPRAVQDIADELNTVRQRLSELWAEEYGGNRPTRGTVRATGVAFPAYSIEMLARREERRKLDEREDQLIAEFEEVKAAARIGPGGAINPATEGKPPEGA